MRIFTRIIRVQVKGSTLRRMAENSTPQTTWELEMKKLNVNRSRLVELNRGSVNAGAGILETLFGCDNTTHTHSAKPTGCKNTFGCMGVNAAESYGRRAMAQAV